MLFCLCACVIPAAWLPLPLRAGVCEHVCECPGRGGGTGVSGLQQDAWDGGVGCWQSRAKPQGPPGESFLALMDDLSEGLLLRLWGSSASVGFSSYLHFGGSSSASVGLFSHLHFWGSSPAVVTGAARGVFLWSCDGMGEMECFRQAQMLALWKV